MRTILTLVASLFATSAFAADMPVRPLIPKAPLAAESYSPFYIGLFGGGGWSQVENELTIPGHAQGPIKAFPTGLVVGGEVGARWNSSLLVYGLNASFAYNFSKAGVGCGPDVAMATGNQCLGYRKDGWLFQQGGEFGINAAGLFGYNASVSQAQNWPVKLPVTSSIWSNVNLTVRGGIAERDLTLCATPASAIPIGPVDPIVMGDPQCGSKFVIGPYVGGRVSAALSGKVEAYVRVDHAFLDSSFTPSPAIQAFDSLNTTRARDEWVAVAGFNFHF